MGEFVLNADNETAHRSDFYGVSGLQATKQAPCSPTIHPGQHHPMLRACKHHFRPPLPEPSGVATKRAISSADTCLPEKAHQWGGGEEGIEGPIGGT